MKCFHLTILIVTGFAPGALAADAPEEKRLPRDNLMLYRGADGKSNEVKSVEDWAKRRAEIVRGAESVMGKLPGPAFRVPLDVRHVEEVRLGDLRRLKITWQSDPDDRVPAYLFLPANPGGRLESVCFAASLPFSPS